jgi:hypothetical protein
MARAERRAALAGWRGTPASERRDACRLAEKGLPAHDPVVSAAARRYGAYLLQRNTSNRLPRSALTVAGVVVLAGGITLACRSWAATPVLAMCIAGGAVVMALGLLSWQQRRAGRLLVAANPPVPAPAEGP